MNPKDVLHKVVNDAIERGEKPVEAIPARSYEEYLEYKAEQRAQGYEVEDYDEWSGVRSSKLRSHYDKVWQDRYDRDEQDLF